MEVRKTGICLALAFSTSASLGCLDREANAPTGQQAQPPPNYAGQPQGYPPPGYGYPQQQYPQQQYPQPPAGGSIPSQQGPSGAPQQQPLPAPSPAPAPTTPAPTSQAPGGFPFPFPFPGAPPAGSSPAPAGSAPPPAGQVPGGFPFPFPFPGAPPAQGGGQPPPAGQAPASGSATPMDPNLASVATVPLTALAQTEAPGMQREGVVLAGQFKEGQTLEQPIQLLPGKCYTVLAVGAGITEMDIALVASTPLPTSPTLAQDSGSGSSASLGARGNCYKWSMPVGIQAKYVLKATKGSGVAAGQLFVK